MHFTANYRYISQFSSCSGNVMCVACRNLTLLILLASSIDLLGYFFLVVITNIEHNFPTNGFFQSENCFRFESRSLLNIEYYRS